MWKPLSFIGIFNNFKETDYSIWLDRVEENFEFYILMKNYLTKRSLQCFNFNNLSSKIAKLLYWRFLCILDTWKLKCINTIKIKWSFLRQIMSFLPLTSILYPLRKPTLISPLSFILWALNLADTFSKNSRKHRLFHLKTP